MKAPHITAPTDAVAQEAMYRPRSTGSGASGLLQTQFMRQAKDTTNSSAAFVTLLTLPITTTGGNLIVHATLAASSQNVDTPNIPAQIQAVIDGTPVEGALENCPASLSLVFKTAAPPAAGPHTVLLQWASPGAGVLQLRPVTAPGQENGSLLVEEVSV